MTLTEYLTLAKDGHIPKRPPIREPGCDDDRRECESWAAWCWRKAREIRDAI